MYKWDILYVRIAQMFKPVYINILRNLIPDCVNKEKRRNGNENY